MTFTRHRWHVATIVARVRASTAVTAAPLDTAARASRKLDILRIADGVDAGRISNDDATASYRRITQDAESISHRSFGPALGI